MFDIGISVGKRDYLMYEAESVCIAKYVKYGVERKDIKTGSGKCHVEYLESSAIKDSTYGKTVVKSSK
jgi:hypothetical protein